LLAALLHSNDGPATLLSFFFDVHTVQGKHITLSRTERA
jgi:hypothetical protein